MRFLLSLLLLAAGPALRAEALRPATPDEVKLFKDAVKNTQQETEHWAYTETTIKKIGLGRKPEGETIVRFDPSKPWAEQYTPVKIEGKAPTEKQLKQYRERGERRGKAIMRRAEQAAATDPSLPDKPKLPPSDRNEKSLKADTEHPLVVSDDGETMIFEVPLIDHGTKLPVEKMEIRAVVAKAARQVRRATLRIKESFRVKLVAKVKEGEGSVDFTVIDPQYAPVMTSGSGTFGGSLLAISVNGVFSDTRTELRRVKPYSERLQVKIGPLELLDF